MYTIEVKANAGRHKHILLASEAEAQRFGRSLGYQPWEFEVKALYGSEDERICEEVRKAA